MDSKKFYRTMIHIYGKRRDLLEQHKLIEKLPKHKRDRHLIPDCCFWKETIYITDDGQIFHYKYGETPLETVKKTITINEAVDWIQRNKNAALAEDFKSTFKKFDSILKSQN